MAKERERKTARILYVEQGKTGKEIAELLKVAEKTITEWVERYGWKKARNAEMTGKEARISNIKSIIDGFATDRIELNAKLKELLLSNTDKQAIAEIRQEMARIDSGVANWNKTLEQLDKNAKVSLSTYLYVMNKIFTNLQMKDPALFVKTIEFQESHINEISIELG